MRQPCAVERRGSENRFLRRGSKQKAVASIAAQKEAGTSHAGAPKSSSWPNAEERIHCKPQMRRAKRQKRELERSPACRRDARLVKEDIANLRSVVDWTREQVRIAFALRCNIRIMRNTNSHYIRFFPSARPQGRKGQKMSRKRAVRDAMTIDNAKHDEANVKAIDEGTAKAVDEAKSETVGKTKAGATAKAIDVAKSETVGKTKAGASEKEASSSGGSHGSDAEGERKAFYARELLAWYRRCKRDLPWRRSRDPYRIWVSEIMLQQTRVETVIPYYHRFMEQFPTIEALADAPEEQVLKAWEGLGYYSRARNLQAAAREVKEEYGGIVPDDPEAVRSLKGVGPYTSGAILSIAYERSEPAVDGNVMRVLSRFFLLTEDIAKPGTRVTIERLARSLIPEGAAGDFNQALMELGATVCTPKSPQCLTCPVMERCGARLEGRVDELPIKAKAKPPRPEARAAALVADESGRLLIRRRPADGPLGAAARAPAGRRQGSGLRRFLARPGRRRRLSGGGCGGARGGARGSGRAAHRPGGVADRCGAYVQPPALGHARVPLPPRSRRGGAASAGLRLDGGGRGEPLSVPEFVRSADPRFRQAVCS